MQTNNNENRFRFGIDFELLYKAYRFLFPVLFVFPLVAFPHADLELQIKSVTAQITANPDNFLLYEKRGELYRRHSDFESALRDFEKLSKIDPENKITAFLIGRALYDSGNADKAVVHLREYLLHKPQHAASLLFIARALSDLGRIDEASEKYRLGIKNAPVKTPDQYVEWSHIFLKPDINRPSDALSVLDEGITAIGPVVSLVDQAVSLQQATGNYAGAIRYLKMLPVDLQTSPRWLIKQADCMYALGNLEQSSHLYQRALQEISALPHARQQIPATRKLKIYIDTKLSS